MNTIPENLFDIIQFLMSKGKQGQDAVLMYVYLLELTCLLKTSTLELGQIDFQKNLNFGRDRAKSSRQLLVESGLMEIGKTRDANGKYSQTEYYMSTVLRVTTMDQRILSFIDTKEIYKKEYVAPQRQDSVLRSKDFSHLSTGLWKYLCEFTFSERARDPEPNMATWNNHFRLMVDVDKRDEELIKEVIDFTVKHDFWSLNIRSPKKLRQQFGRLVSEMEKANL